MYNVTNTPNPEALVNKIVNVLLDGQPAAHITQEIAFARARKAVYDTYAAAEMGVVPITKASGPLPNLPDAWTSVSPAVAGYYWHWNGKQKSAPKLFLITMVDGQGSVMGEGGSWISCTTHGGYWIKVDAPDTNFASA